MTCSHQRHVKDAFHILHMSFGHRASLSGALAEAAPPISPAHSCTPSLLAAAAAQIATTHSGCNNKATHCIIQGKRSLPVITIMGYHSV